MKNSRILIILRGIPGSGKSTLADWLEYNLIQETLTVAADDFMVDDAGNYSFDVAKLKECHTKCKEKVEAGMKEDYEVIIVHNTSTTEKELSDYLDMAVKHDYSIVSLIVENRHGNHNVHNVPDEKLEQMKKRFSVHL